MRALSLSAVGLVFLVGCGGGSGSSTPGPATGLSYTDPSGTGWRLVKGAESTPQRLVLNLVGPPGLRGRGVGIVFRGSSTFTWGRLEGALAKDLGVLDYVQTPSDPYPGEPILFLAGTKGLDLHVSAYQKNRELTAKPMDQPLFAVALDLTPDQNIRVGEKISMSVSKAVFLPEYMTKNQLEPIQIAVGVIKAR